METVRTASTLDPREDRIAGILLGTALGDALGLACEGMSAKLIRRRYGRVARFHFLFRTGYVSDDTELSALIGQSLIRGRGNPASCRTHFRRALRGWFLRLPWGIGFSTLRACLKLCFGLSNSGLPSAGNGAAMRSAIIGGYVPSDTQRRRELARTLAEVTHTDPRGVAGAVFVADLTSACMRHREGERDLCFIEALNLVEEADLKERLTKVYERHRSGFSDDGVPAEFGTGGFVLESVPLAAYCFLANQNPLSSLSRCISFGGDTDSTAAILGAWLGALLGASGLPEQLLERLQRGPFGRQHLQQIARSIARGTEAPRYVWPIALLRNLALYPVVLAHGFRRLIPF